VARTRRQTGKFGSPASPATRAAEDQLEILRIQPAVQRARLLLPMLGERQVGDRGVLAGQTPFGLSMPDQIEGSLAWGSPYRSVEEWQP
jgi:hypothetical protein